MKDIPLHYRGVYRDTIGNRFRNIFDKVPRRSREFTDKACRPEVPEKVGIRATNPVINSFTPDPNPSQSPTLAHSRRETKDKVIAEQDNPTELTFQEQAVYTHAFINFLEENMSEEGIIDDKVTLTDVEDFLSEDIEERNRALRRVASRGIENYLGVRKRAMEKVERGLVLASSNLGFIFTFLGEEKILLIHEKLAKLTSEEIGETEFPRGLVNKETPALDALEVPEREKTEQDKVAEYIDIFDSVNLLDIKRGIPMHIPWRIFGRLDSKRFHKAIDIGLIKPLSQTSYVMDRFSRRDIFKLLWAIDSYNIFNMLEDEIEKTEEVAKIYDEIMEDKKRQQGIKKSSEAGK